jgi:hypothetical protein
MLGQHPQMYSILESQIFEVETVADWWLRYGKSNHDGDGLLRSVAEIVYGTQTRWTVEEAKAWLWDRRDCCAMADVFNELSETLYPLRIVEKTPVEGLNEQDVYVKLERRLKRAPRARFIHLVRHPMGYCLSHLEHLEKMNRSCPFPERMARRYERVTDPSTDPPTVDPQVLWHRVNSAMCEFLAKLPAEQHKRIQGEDLVTRPDECLREISEWIGVRSDVRALDEMKHPERSPFACLGPRNARWGGDPKFFREPRLRLTRPSTEPLLGKALPWRRDGQGFTTQVCALAGQFGYQ